MAFKGFKLADLRVDIETDSAEAIYVRIAGPTKREVMISVRRDCKTPWEVIDKRVVNIKPKCTPDTCI